MGKGGGGEEGLRVGRRWRVPGVGISRAAAAAPQYRLDGRRSQSSGTCFGVTRMRSLGRKVTDNQKEGVLLVGYL